MKHTRIAFLVLFAALLSVCVCKCAAQQSFEGSERDRVALQKTGDAIRAAFAAGDVDAVMRYHHRDVEKWFSPTEHVMGREALRAGMEKTFQSARVEFVSNEVESLLFAGESAVEVSSFVIRATPKNGGAPSLLKGRAMVVYIRSSESPTGWASIRELIQPAS
jgi:ketosteroid isomerase-like protein